MSLDIEGAEYKVLQTIDWNTVDIEVVLVEMINLGKMFPGTREDVHDYLKSVNYVYIGTISMLKLEKKI